MLLEIGGARYAGRVIQVCSQCGTRWNVRNRQRAWCPRCNGTLLAPPAHQVPLAPPAPQAPGRPESAQAPAVQARAGFRWIAVRPGPPPPPRRHRRPLGPTPRYQSVPRWGLIDRIAPPAAEQVSARKRASSSAAQHALLIAGAVFALAAAAHILRYLLMLINRTTLLPPFVAIGSLLSGIFVSLAAITAVIGAAVVLTSWLIGRRAAAFARHGQADPRPELVLWLGCLVPVVNWFFAPLFVLELAQAEGCRDRQSRPIVLWSVAWIVATLISGWATWTGLKADEPQAVADNTVTEILAYLAGLAVIILLWRVLDGFVRRPVERPLHRWTIVPPGSTGDAPTDDVTPADEPEVADDLAAPRDRESVA